MIELEVVPACEEYGLGLIPWSPLAGGMLGGALAKAKEGRRAGEHTMKQIHEHKAQLEEYEKLCDDLGERPADIALSWLFHQPNMTSPIIGPRTIAQLEGSLHALKIELDNETLAKLDEIWPGPGGPAPEAYAW